MRILLPSSAALASAFIVLGSSATAPVSAGQPPDPTAPVAIVENFRLARKALNCQGAHRAGGRFNLPVS
jgi:hypothetical protein